MQDDDMTASCRSSISARSIPSPLMSHLRLVGGKGTSGLMLPSGGPQNTIGKVPRI